MLMPSIVDARRPQGIRDAPEPTPVWHLPNGEKSLTYHRDQLTVRGMSCHKRPLRCSPSQEITKEGKVGVQIAHAAWQLGGLGGIVLGAIAGVVLAFTRGK